MTEKSNTDGPSTLSSNCADSMARTVQFDWSEPEQPTEAIITALASATGCDPLDIEPLHERIDGDALNSLVTPSGEHQTNLRVSFQCDGYTVLVTGNGEVTVESRKREATNDDR